MDFSWRGQMAAFGVRPVTRAISAVMFVIAFCAVADAGERPSPSAGRGPGVFGDVTAAALTGDWNVRTIQDIGTCDQGKVGAVESYAWKIVGKPDGTVSVGAKMLSESVNLSPDNWQSGREHTPDDFLSSVEAGRLTGSAG